MKTKQKVFISVGYKKRELEYLSLFTAFLESAGYEVRIKYFDFEIYAQLLSWQPDIVILGQVNQGENIEAAQFAKKLGAQVVVLNCEGTYREDQDVQRFGKHVNSYVDLLIAWGKKHDEDAIKFSDIDPKKVVTCGTPKFDFYHPRTYAYYQHHRPYQDRLDPKKKTICVSTAFASADSNWQKVKNNIVASNMGQAAYEHMVSSQQALRKSHVELAIELAKQHTWNIIFRIHPLERPNYYYPLLEQYPEIIFDNSVGSAELLTVTDLLIHRSSTLALEAWVVNVPTVSFDPLFNSDKEMLSFTPLNPIVHTVSEVVKYVRSWSHTKKQVDRDQKKKQAFLHYWFNITERPTIFASEKIIAHLKKLPISSKRIVFHPYIVVYSVLDLLRRLLGKQYVYQVIGLFKGNAYVEVVRDNYITAQEVAHRTQKYRRLLKERQT